QPGTRVVVPFGRREHVAVIVATDVEPLVAETQIKPILRCLDDAPVLDTALLQLCRWCARYYHHPLGEVLATVLPASLRRAHTAERRLSRGWRALPTAADSDHKLTGAPLQRALWQAIQASGETVAHSDLLARWPTAARPWQRLAERGLIAAVERPHTLARGHACAGPELTADQHTALDSARAAGDTCVPQLLEGVTGSGKTEVYFRRITDMLEQRRQVLFLAPEIGLTPQLINRVQSRFNARIGVLHSARSDGERANVWLAARAGEADIIIGTRSAIF